MPRLSHRAALLSLLLVSCGGKDAPAAPAPTLQASPLALALADTLLAGTILLTTKPPGDSLEWHVGAKPDWLTLSPDYGTVSGVAPVTVTATARVSATQEPGTMTGVIQLVSGGGPVNVGVTVRVGPHLAVSPTSLAIAEASNVATVTLSNTGHGVVSWRATPSVSWLAVSPISGFLGTAESVVVSVVPNRTSLPPGTSSASITILSGVDAVGVQLPVSVGVAPPPP